MILKIINRNKPIQNTIEVVNLKNFDTIMMGLGGEGDVAFINSTSAQYIYLTSPIRT